MAADDFVRSLVPPAADLSNDLLAASPPSRPPVVETAPPAVDEEDVVVRLPPLNLTWNLNFGRLCFLLLVTDLMRLVLVVLEASG